MAETQTLPMLHIRYDGASHDIPLTELDLGDLSSDADIRARVAQYLDQPVAKLQGFQIDKNTETGDITVRPQAIFG